MFSFRGDAHKLFLTLKKEENIHSNKDIKEASEIKSFYQSLESETLRLIYYRMVKEQNGTGIIPIFVTAIPWLLFLFSDKVQEFLFKDGILIWMIFITIYLMLLTFSAFFHFKEKAWSALHIEVIKSVLEGRGE